MKLIFFFATCKSIINNGTNEKNIKKVKYETGGQLIENNKAAKIDKIKFLNTWINIKELYILIKKNEK